MKEGWRGGLPVHRVGLLLGAEAIRQVRPGALEQETGYRGDKGTEKKTVSVCVQSMHFGRVPPELGRAEEHEERSEGIILP